MKNQFKILIAVLFISLTSCEKDDFSDANNNTSSYQNNTLNNNNQNSDPIGFNLTKIKIVEWPSNNNGYYWDNDYTTPDPRIEINLGATAFLHTGCLANPQQFQTLSIGTFNDPNNFPISLDVNTTYDFRVYDYDAGESDDLMLNSYFILSNYSNSTPSVITFTYSSNDWKFELYGTWTY